METISIHGRPTRGFAIGDAPPGPVPVTPVVAALAVGATAGLLVNLLKAPLWGAILAGTGAAITTKYAIDFAGDRAARGA